MEVETTGQENISSKEDGRRVMIYFSRFNFNLTDINYWLLYRDDTVQIHTLKDSDVHQLTANTTPQF